MTEVYGLRTPENFNYNSNRRTPSAKIKQRTPSNDLLLKPPSSANYTKSNSPRIRPELYHFKVREKDTENSKYRSSPPVGRKEKQKSPMSHQPPHEQKQEMYYLHTPGGKKPENRRLSISTNDSDQKPKLNGILRNSSSPRQKKITTYMITASIGDNFLPYIPDTSSSSISPNKKKQLVSFDTINDNKKYKVSNKQHHFPPINSHVPLSQSKATESIQRSMNKYRYRRY